MGVFDMGVFDMGVVALGSSDSCMWATADSYNPSLRCQALEERGYQRGVCITYRKIRRVREEGGQRQRVDEGERERERERESPGLRKQSRQMEPSSDLIQESNPGPSSQNWQEC